jgi:hypothetical protein
LGAHRGGGWSIGNNANVTQTTFSGAAAAGADINSGMFHTLWLSMACLMCMSTIYIHVC